jgi:hypothetical protein
MYYTLPYMYMVELRNIFFVLILVMRIFSNLMYTNVRKGAYED